MSIFPAYETERLILREFELEDIDAIHTYLSDPAVSYYMMQDATTKEQSLNYVHRFLELQREEPRKIFKFAIILKSNNRLIGECGLNCPNHFHKEGEIVYRLSKDYWGKGYATEAVKEVISFGFKELSLHRIEALCDSRNSLSTKVLQKAGMTYEGCMREHRWVKGRWRDSNLYSILISEYKLKHKNLK